MSADENTTVPADDPTAEESSQAVEITESGESTDDSSDGTAEKVSDEKPARGGDRGIVRRNIGAILVAVALVASAGVAGWLYFSQYRIDQQTNADATNVALEAAKNGTVALLSYSPESLDKDFAAAKSNLTGDFLSYYTQFTEQIVTPRPRKSRSRRPHR